MKRYLLLALCLLLTPALAAEPVYLDVGIEVFDAQVPPDTATVAEEEFPRIRRAEAVLLPVQLRRRLEASGLWGAVRVMPRASELVDLTVRAHILESSGLRLALQVTARDATGRTWLDRRYADDAVESDYPVPVDGDPYADLYDAVANDLAAGLRALDARSLEEIQLVARMRYAADLSPEAFAGYLGGGGETPWTLLRLPAQDDPMLERVERIRNQEYLFVDNVDEQYTRLYDQLAPTYNLWRQYQREQAVYQAGYEQRVAERDTRERHGSFSAMLRDYSTYRAYRIQQQDLEELAAGFNNEAAPTVVETRGRVFRLSGSLESRYDEWRGILRDIFRLETELPATPAGGGDSAAPGD